MQFHLEKMISDTAVGKAPEDSSLLVEPSVRANGRLPSHPCPLAVR